MRVGGWAELSRHVCWRERDGGVGGVWRRWWRSGGAGGGERKGILSRCLYVSADQAKTTLLQDGAVLTIEGMRVRRELRFDGAQKSAAPEMAG